MIQTTTSDIAHVHPAQLSDWLSLVGNNGIKPIVLDVREPWELQRASVSPLNCSVIAIPMMQLQARLTELDPETPTAVLCHHGVRSLQVAKFLAHRGFSSVANISGGIAAWANDFDATVAQY
jgi:rhodanese-related sulfurtransferase